MAEQDDSFKEQFDNQLTCNVCLDQYTDPKVLPCIHSFCLKCIQLTPTIIKVISLLQLVQITHLYTIELRKSLSQQFFPYFSRMVKITSVVQHVVLIIQFLKEGSLIYQMPFISTVCLTCKKD